MLYRRRTKIKEGQRSSKRGNTGNIPEKVTLTDDPRANRDSSSYCTLTRRRYFYRQETESLNDRFIILERIVGNRAAISFFLTLCADLQHMQRAIYNIEKFL